MSDAKWILKSWHLLLLYTLCVQLQSTAVTLLCKSLQLKRIGTLLIIPLCRAEWEICYYSALCLSPKKWWSESRLLPARQGCFLVSLFLPVANSSSSVIQLLMSSSFPSQQALFALAFVPCKYSPAKSLCDELPSVLSYCSISISPPHGSALPPLPAPGMWVLGEPGAAGYRGLERVEAAWVMSWSPADLQLSPGLRQAGYCAHLQWGYLSVLHHWWN